MGFANFSLEEYLYYGTVLSNKERAFGMRLGAARPKEGIFRMRGSGLLAALLCCLLLITLIPAEAIAAPRSLGNDGLEGGQPGTIRGKVYDDHRHNPEIYNASTRLDPQDWPIAGVKMKAMLIKSDGTVIMSRDEFNNPVPFEATTNADGDYTFNFRPALREAYNLPADAENPRVRIERFDRVRVWVDESNYNPGGPLADFTPKRLNGGGRFNVVDTLTLSWLGTTNYIHGSISNFNMAFRPKTVTAAATNDAWNKDDVNGHPASRQAPADPLGNEYDKKGKHLPKNQWVPSSRHIAPDTRNVNTNLFLCGHVYADRTFRFDRWDSAPGKRDRTAAKDPAVPGVRVVVSSYAQDGLGKPTDILQTRYDYTDMDGAFCIGWDDVSEVHNRPISAGASPAKFMVTIEPPANYEEAEADIKALINKDRRPQAEDAGTEKAKSEGLYNELLKPENKSRILKASSSGSGLPEGFAAVGANGWYGTIRPAYGNAGAPFGTGVSSVDGACEFRTGYCLPDLLVWEVAQAVGQNNYQLAGTGLDLGLIPTLPEVDYSRHSTESVLANESTIDEQESKDAKTIWANIRVPMPGFSYRLVAVPRGSSWDSIASERGSWYFANEEGWVTSEDVATKNNGLMKMQVPEGFPTGDYQMALVSKREPQKDALGNSKGQTEYDVINIAPLRVTDSKVFTYTGNITKGSDEAAENDKARQARDDAYGKSQEGEASYTALPGQKVYTSYLDLGESRDADEGTHRVELCDADADGKLKLTEGKPTCREVDSQIRPDTKKNANGVVEVIEDQFAHKSMGEWNVPVDLAAGNYLMRLVHTKAKQDFDVTKPIDVGTNYPLKGMTIPRDEVVDQRPFTVLEPFIDAVSKPCGEDGKTAGDVSVTLKGLHKGTSYTLTFKPNGDGTEISKQITASCDGDGICSQQVTFTEAELDGIRANEANTGRGALTLARGDTKLDTDSMRVLSQKQCETTGGSALGDGWEWDQPEIVLPYTEIHLGYTPKQNADYATEIIPDPDTYTQFNRIKYGGFYKNGYNKKGTDAETADAGKSLTEADFETNCVENPTVGELNTNGEANRNQDKNNSSFCHIPCLEGTGEGSCQQLYGAPYGTPVYLTPYRRSLNSGALATENAVAGTKEAYRNGPIRVEVRDGKDYQPGSVLSDRTKGGSQSSGQLIVWNSDGKLKNSVQTKGDFSSAAGGSSNIDYGAWQFYNKVTGKPVDGFNDIVWRVRGNGKYYDAVSGNTGERWPTLVWGNQPGGGSDDSRTWWSNKTVWGGLQGDKKRWENEVGTNKDPGYFLVRPGGEKMPNKDIVLCSPKMQRNDDGSIPVDQITGKLNTPDGCVTPPNKSELNVGVQVLTFDYQTQKAGDYLSREWMSETKVLDKNGNPVLDSNGNEVIHKGVNSERALPKAQTKQAVLVPYNARRFYNENWSNPRPHQFHWGEPVGFDGRWIVGQYNTKDFNTKSTDKTEGGGWASKQWDTSDWTWDAQNKVFKTDSLVDWNAKGSFCKYIFRYHNGTNYAGTISNGYNNQKLKFIPKYEQEKLWRELGLDIVTVMYNGDNNNLPSERVGCVISTDAEDGVPIYSKGSFMDKYRNTRGRAGFEAQNYDKNLEESLPDEWNGKPANFNPHSAANKPTGRLRYGAPLGIHDLQVDVIDEPQFAFGTPNSRITLPEPWRIEVLPDVDLKDPVITAWTGEGAFSPAMDGEQPASGTTVWKQGDTYRVHRGDNFDLKFLAGPKAGEAAYQIKKFEPMGDNRPKGVNLGEANNGKCLTDDGGAFATGDPATCNKRIIKLDGTVAGDATLGVYQYKVTATSTNSSDHGEHEEISFIMNIEVLAEPAAKPTLKPADFYGTVNNPVTWGPLEYTLGKNSDGTDQKLDSMRVVNPAQLPEGVSFGTRCEIPGGEGEPCKKYGYYFIGTPTKEQQTWVDVELTVRNNDGKTATVTARYNMTVANNETVLTAQTITGEAGTLLETETNYVGKPINSKDGHKSYSLFGMNGVTANMKKGSGFTLEYETPPADAAELNKYPVLSLEEVRDARGNLTDVVFKGQLNNVGEYKMVARWTYQDGTVVKVAKLPITVTVEDATPPNIDGINDQEVYLGENGQVAADTVINNVYVKDNDGKGSYPVAITGHSATDTDLTSATFCAPVVGDGGTANKPRKVFHQGIEYTEDVGGQTLTLTGQQGRLNDSGVFEPATDVVNDPWQLTVGTEGKSAGTYMCHVNFTDATGNTDRNTTQFSPNKSLNKTTHVDENWLGERMFLLNIKQALELNVMPDEETIVKGSPMFRPMNVEAFSHGNPSKINVQTLCAPSQASDGSVDGLPSDQNGQPSVGISDTKFGVETPNADQIGLDGYKARTVAKIDGNANDAQVGTYKCYVYAVGEGFTLNDDGTVSGDGTPIEGVNWVRKPITVHVVEAVLPKTGVFSLNYVAGYAALLIVALAGGGYLYRTRRGESRA